MKLRTLLALLVGAFAWAGYANRAVAQPSSGGKPVAPPPGGLLERALQTLTPEERQEFLAARQAAAKNDPALKATRQAMEAAQKEFTSVMKIAMLEQDPSLQPVFDKLEAPAPVAAGPSAVPGQQGRQAHPPQANRWPALLWTLTQEERQKMQAAHSAVRNEPEVQRVESARAATDKEFHEALQTAMLQADPAVGPIIDKVEAAVKQLNYSMRHPPGNAASPPPIPAPSVGSSPAS